MAAKVRQEAMREAVARVYAESENDDDSENMQTAHRGLMVGFVVVAEFMGDDGDSYMTVTPDPDAPVWRTMGLLAAAIETRNQMMQEMWGDDDA